jgi:hypothetical protein
MTTSAPASSKVIAKAYQTISRASPEPPHPHRLPLEVAIRRASTTIRTLRKVAKYRLAKDKSASWIADLIEGQARAIEVLVFNAKHKKTIRDAVQAKLDAIRDIEEDERVKAVMAAFPDAEISDVKEMEEEESR